MKHGICRNCRQQAVFKKKADADYAIPIKTLSVSAVYHFICANCGYIENYILDAGKLRQIEQHWEYVPPQDAPRRTDEDDEDG
ncbi:MAG: hypothetical protein MUE40_09165 [Anaerolineae bacterium]|jgi:RNase P subunit RPR2|nr:hypothetical protein [Anaerolineae bacterium]